MSTTNTRCIWLMSDATAYGGAEKYLSLIASECIRRHLNVFGLIPPDDSLTPWAAELEQFGLKVTRSDITLRKLLHMRREYSADFCIIHMNASWRGNYLFFLLLAKCLGFSLVLTEHNLPPQTSLGLGFRRFAPWRLRLKLRTLRRQVEWHIADRIIIVSNLVKSKLAALKRADVDLLLIGDGPEHARLEKMAVELGVRQRVYFAGWRKNVEDFLNAMDIFVLPSDFEAMPFSIIEAMACGVPVVASDVGGISDIVEDGSTGFLVPPGDISKLTRCIRCLIFDEDMRQRFGRGSTVQSSQAVLREENASENTTSL